MKFLIRRCCLLGLVASLCGSCSAVPEQQGLLEAEIPDAKVSSRNLRAMVSEYVPSYAHKIEATADKILAGSEDPSMRRNALLWKINAISAGFGAASRPDPLASYFDLWVLTRQMRHLFELAEQPQFGPWQADAIATCQQLDVRLVEINNKLDSHLTFVESFVEETAREHPMSDLYFDRTPLATENIEKIHRPKHDVLHVVASMQDDVKDMQRLSALYAEYLPKQARWQAELLALDMHKSPVVESTLADLTVASSAMHQLAASASKMQKNLDHQLAAMPQLVDTQRQLATQDLIQMQAATLAQLRAEREAVMLAVHQEQQAVRQWVQATATGSVDRADAITRKRIVQSASEAERLLDRAAVYGGTLFAAAGFLGFLFFVWFRLVGRQQRKETVGHTAKSEPINFGSGRQYRDETRRAA